MRDKKGSALAVNRSGKHCLTQSFAETSEYQRCWEVLLKGLNSDEPAIRYYSLRCVQLSAHSFRRTLVRVELQVELVRSLVDILASQEVRIIKRQEHTSLAAVCLGNCAIFMVDDAFPGRYRRLAFTAVVNTIIKLVPCDIVEVEQQQKIIITQHTLQVRIQLIAGVSSFFKTPEALDPQFMKYIDLLFVSLLKSHSHTLLHAAVLRAIAVEMPKTNMNRWRIERHYRSILQSVSDSSAFHSQDQKKRKETAIYFKKMVNLFWAVWYPKPSDVDLLKNSPSTPSTPGGAVLGYSKRRTLAILSNLALLTSTQTDEYKRLSLQQMSRLAYQNTECPMTQMKCFEMRTINGKSSLILEYIPIVTPLEDIELTLVKAKGAVTIKIDLNPMEIEFGPGQQTFSFYITNESSTSSTSFYIQVSEPHFFEVSPSFGILSPSESLVIHTKFIPRITEFRRTAIVHGYLCVRSKTGIPKARFDIINNRIALNGFNLPAVHVYNRNLDFGFCMLNKKKNITFEVENLLPADCPIFLAMSNQFKSMFTLPFTQAMMMKDDTTTITISCIPTISGSIKSRLYLIAFGIQVIEINLTIYCGIALKVLDTELNFGPTDIYYNGAKRNMVLINNDSTHAIPVTAETSTDEIIFNNGIPLILQPLEERSVPIEFKAALCGNRVETVKLTAPNSNTSRIQVLAFAGPELSVPVHEDIYFPPTVCGQTTYIRVPFTNISDGFITYKTQMADNVPVKILALDANIVNSHSNANSVHCEPIKGSQHNGMMVTLAPRTSVLLEFGFFGKQTGIFKFSLVTELIQPRFGIIATHFMYVAMMDANFLQSAWSLQSLRDFFVSPYFVPLTSSFEHVEKVEMGLGSPIFRFVEQSRAIFGPQSRYASQVPCQFVTIQNLTHQTQKYKIILSSHFRCGIPIDGELIGAVSLEIPIFIDPSFYTNSESIHYNILGAICAIDSASSQPNVAVCQLHGFIGELVWNQIREGVKSLRFPIARAQDTQTKIIVIRNKSYLELQWSGELLPSKNLMLQNNSDLPFTLSPSKVTLKPFEYCTIEVTFRSPQNGDYKCHLEMFYAYTFEFLSKSTERPLDGLNIKFSVGSQQAILNTEEITYGSVVVGSSLTRRINVSNQNNTACTVNFAEQKALELSKSSIEIQPKSSFDLLVTYKPLEPKVWQKFLEYYIGGTTYSIPLLGISGNLDIAADIVELCVWDQLTELSNVKPRPENILDFGDIGYEVLASKTLRLRNNGCLHVKIAEVDFGDQRYLTWNYREEDPKMISKSFYKELATASEIDWDEHDKVNINTPTVNVARRTPKIEEAPIVNIRSDALKIFPNQDQEINIYLQGKAVSLI